eukprot:469321_1
MGNVNACLESPNSIHNSDTIISTTQNLKNGIEDRLDELLKKGENVDDYLWELLTKYGHAKNNNTNKTNNKSVTTQISTLVDFKNLGYFGMCDVGHSMSTSWPVDKQICNKCETKDCNVRGCLVCCSKEIYESGGGKQYLLCHGCKMDNVNKVKQKWERDENKRQIIRNILFANPALELDLLVGLPKAAALINTLDEITKLHVSLRNKYCLYLIDLDNFKALNSAIGHDGADRVIVDIANIFKKYQQQTNDNEWSDKKHGNIQRLFAYRQGGDEFAVIVQSGEYDAQKRQKIFFESIKQEINCLGNKYLHNINKENEKKKK